MAFSFVAILVLASPVPVACATSTFWHTVKDYDAQPLLHGKATFREPPENYFNRLPASSVNTTRPSIYGLQQQPAGMFVQFRTNASAVRVRYTLGHAILGMFHFPPTGVSGMDAYAWDDTNAAWRWTGTSHPAFPITESTLAQLHCAAPHCPEKTFRIHLPTYNTIADDFSVGVDSAFDTFVPDESHFQNPKNASIVWYGSSILQGAVASRPGQIMTHEVSRNLDTLILNFGFSGNCLMEQSVAAYLVQIDPSPSLFIIDCNPNMNYSLISNRAIPLIQFIRNNGHPTTPIIMTEGTRHGSDWYSNTSRVGRLNKTVALREAFNILVAAGDMHLYYSTAEDIYSDSLGMNPDVSGDRRFLVDPTVAGTHPTDLGMRKQAAWWTKTIPAILKADRACETTLRSPADAYAFETPQSKVLASAFPMPEENMRDDSNDVFTRRDSFQWIDGATFLRGISTFTDRDGGHVLPRVSPYQRLPQVAKKDVREQVWTLSELSTGTYLRFASNASTIAINHTLAFPTQHLWHMPYTGTDGLDVYAYSRADKAWRHIPITKGIELCGVLKDKLISCENVTSSHAMMSGVFHKPEPVGQKESEQNTYWTYLVYLPLRNAPKELSVGVPSNALVCSKINEKSSQMSGIGDCKDAAPSFDENKPIVWYGTSIQQGGVASRAGNEYDAIISRALGVDIHNFGFAGNGKMELSVAKYLAMVPASVLIIDCLPNMDAASVTERTIPLVQFLRKNGHATTPIVLAEGTPYPAEWLNGSPYADTAKNEALKQAFDTLVGTLGVKGLYYVKGSDLFKSKLVNPTVGGVHSSDLGQYMIADYYVGFLPAVLAGKVESS